MTEEIKELKIKYNKALDLLCDYNMPCEIDEDFMEKNEKWCEKNCASDGEVFPICWNKYIEWVLKDD